MALVDLRGITYRYPLSDQPALEDVSLQVETGEFVALIGPNGAGKSTLCYTISGFIPYFFEGELEGALEVAGLRPEESSLGEWVLRVGLVFENPFNQMSGSKFTVYEEIGFGLENTGVPREEMRARVGAAMEMTGITDLAQRSPYSLSGGQQQSVALTSILVMEPTVLVLDEPTSQLDPIGTQQVLHLVKKMSQRGVTVVMAGHKLEWIAEYADRVVALWEGRKLLDGTPAEVLTSPVLPERGFGVSRYTSVARKAATHGLWPPERRLPITLDEAVDGFSGGTA